MKSRYKKHLKRIENRSPIIAFSIDNLYNKSDIINTESLHTFNKYMGLNSTEAFSTKYKSIKEEMHTNLIMFTDNYLMCGNHEYIYLLLPLLDGTYKVIEKENKTKWANAYWKKEDPNNERDWCFIDEDIDDLFCYIIEKFEKHIKTY
ncbi:hypothetical protein bcgnr5369_01640 [Bacillus cereus]